MKGTRHSEQEIIAILKQGLDRMASERGLPEAIVVGNGPEFRGRALAAWSEQRGVRLDFI
jgi:hypothetical protein